MRAFFRTPAIAVSIAVALASLVACNKTQQAAAPQSTAASAGPAVATVDGSPISRAEYDLYVKNLLQGKQQELTAEQKGQVLDDLINMQVLAEQAEKDGLQNDPDTVAQLHVLHQRVLADAESQKFIKSFQPSDADLHAEYEMAVASMDKNEYKARHILVPTKEEGEKVIKKLKSGAKFEDLAKAESTDTGSKNNGGELGWFTTSRMVKPFADAVTGLKKGEITPEPVQTQFGWHVIQLEDTREKAPPPFEQVKAQVSNQLIRKKLQAYVADLKKNDKIEKKTL
ncbi:MAG TPA: peptidylprolyl isomerase [Steroidobacteraceae bacterium]|nr:peptidylprolyl isomerase [Steroidobacteraceae bacterium]